MDPNDFSCMGEAPASQGGELGVGNRAGEMPDCEGQTEDGEKDLEDAGDGLADADSLGYGSDPFNK